MKEKIKNNLDKPGELEQLYRRDKKGFEKNFYEILPEIEGHSLAGFWKARLEEERPKDLFAGLRGYDIFVLIGSCLLASLLISLPDWFGFDRNTTHFYERNAFLIGFMGLSLYILLSRKQLKGSMLLITGLAFLIPAVYINLLPVITGSHTQTLAYLHLPILMWGVFGLVYMNWDLRDKEKRIDFLKYNGEMGVLGAVLVLAGAALAGITISLFTVIDIHIEEFFGQYVALWAAVSAPIITAFIVRFFPAITQKVAPIIARVFSPLVLITLVVYLFTIVVTGKNPYNDREFLMVFNLMLIGVMGLIVFSVPETASGSRQRFNEMTLFLLSVVALLINLVALSAIVYRLGEFGFTPNRTAVLGANLLIFIHLAWIALDLFRVNFRSKPFDKVQQTIASFLPVYLLWMLIVIFLFPLIFGWWVV
ncbi:MAG: hypothetical protein V2I46_08660 [Bacteroides sp.]|jgi:hypothetical protein|nr:hypothetical protein [Bacteroides sp.]